jgi:hypothetical protein
MPSVFVRYVKPNTLTRWKQRAAGHQTITKRRIDSGCCRNALNIGTRALGPDIFVLSMNAGVSDTLRRMYKPMTTSTMLHRNGTRHPQAVNVAVPIEPVNMNRRPLVNAALIDDPVLM